MMMTYLNFISLLIRDKRAEGFPEALLFDFYFLPHELGAREKRR